MQKLTHFYMIHKLYTVLWQRYSHNVYLTLFKICIKQFEKFLLAISSHSHSSIWILLCRPVNKFGIWVQVQLSTRGACDYWWYTLHEDSYAYLRRFRRKTRKILNGQVDKRDRELNPAPPVYQFWVQNFSATGGAL